ncbi:MAG: hypothetical protein QXG86_01635 [Candidatus Woesearchaeota archaeon]
MSFARKAFELLYPDKKAEINVVYSGKLRNYGAKVSYNQNKTKFDFILNKKWESVDEDIKIGLVQSLLLKIFRDKKTTFNVDLYNNFVKHLHIAIPKNKIDPLLYKSFNRINEKYFLGLIEMPNLVFGKSSLRTLGHYDYKTDTITISRILNKREDLIDFVMYHEILHKKHKFKPGLNNRYHTLTFREEEKKFENYEYWEKELENFLRKKRVIKWFSFLS